jgi:hypothetical protein
MESQEQDPLRSQHERLLQEHQCEKNRKEMKDQRCKNSSGNVEKKVSNFQDNVKQAEITIFNTMSIKLEETTGNFMDRLIEQAEKLVDMGEEVSELRKMTKVKEGLASKYIHLAHSLVMQSDINWEKLEALVRSYKHSIFAQPSRKTEDDGKVPAANMAFTKTTRVSKYNDKTLSHLQEARSLG